MLTENQVIPERKWVKYLDLSKMHFYPLQFANCERLRNNDVVYIFDEAGCGKTISGGLMAIDYLEQHPDEKVLVITINALVKHKKNEDYGVFLDKWYKKLPFKQLHYDERVLITNNYFSNIQKFIGCQNIGLIIIDEAHLFLNNETLRYKAFENIHSQKVVFLTATPIKSSIDDLKKYVQMASTILGDKKVMSADWIDMLKTTENAELICSKFDTKYPATRCFKGILKHLEQKEDEAVRCSAELWKYTRENKMDVLVKEITNILEQQGGVENRFVIFTRFVEKEARAIFCKFVKAFGYDCKHEYSADSKGYKQSLYNNKTGKSVAVVTGENSEDLRKYEGLTDLPTVLILTYQIAEQGINLPGYNYVVNYHIAASPSALEQRFGRIDRLPETQQLTKTSLKEIHACYLIPDNFVDGNLMNFVYAINCFSEDILSWLPSRNVILTETLLKLYSDTKKSIYSYIETLKNRLDIEMEKNICDKLRKGDLSNINAGLCDFIVSRQLNEIIISSSLSNGDIKNIIEAELNGIANSICNTEDSIKKCEELLEKSENSIIYLSECNGRIYYSNVTTEYCAKKLLSCKDYICYKDNIEKSLKVPFILKEQHEFVCEVNRCFEKAFEDNKFDLLFTLRGRKKLLKEIFDNQTTLSEYKELLLQAVDVIVSRLPIFNVFDIFRRIIQSYFYAEDGIRVRFNTNPFQESKSQLFKLIENTVDKMGLSAEFVEKYKYNREDDFALLSINNSLVEATNWYKLAYWYTRREEICIDSRFPAIYLKEKNAFRGMEEVLKEMSNCFLEHPQNWKCYFDEFDIYLERKKGEVLHSPFEWYESAFHGYLFSKNEPRVYVKESQNLLGNMSLVNKRVRDGDVWSEGICYEICKWIKCICNWSDLLDLPDEYRLLPFCYEFFENEAEELYLIKLDTFENKILMNDSMMQLF